jgi:hypothetical protein
VPERTTEELPRVSILAPSGGLPHRPSWLGAVALHPIRGAGVTSMLPSTGDPMNAATTAPVGISADRSMRVFEWVVALFAVASALMVGLVR